MNVIKYVRFTVAGRAALLDFLREAYGERFDRLDIEACASEAILSIESDINEGNDCGQWEVGSFFTASRRPELFRAYIGSEVEVFREDTLEE